jgi:hypothetical protein
MNEPNSLRNLRWTARILSVLCVGIVLMFALGERLSLSAITGRDYLLFLFFPVGVCLGMVLAWWWEGVGGGIAIGSLVVFYLIHLFAWQRFPRGLAFMLLAMPGFLFLACRLWSWRARQKGV